MSSEENQASGDGVHRLVDMIVEEVSLVDRAANKHRFLIVKRDDTMDEDTTIDDAGDGLSGAEAGSASADPNSPLEAAVEALERLTEIVELLGALGTSPAGAAALDLAAQLRMTAEALLARIDTAPDGVAFEDVALRSKAVDLPAEGATEPPSDLALAKAAVASMRELAVRPSGVLPVRETKALAKDSGGDSAADSAAVTKGLESLAASLKTLTELVREQQQRIGRVEKQFGLPSSAGAPEPVVAAPAKALGWPLDLNKPMDRENVDKAVSFHDL